ncbi:unnamed protein product [Schistosoma margrebowiei]|uniref:Uncharacterized protein n=1 Tax=Schistosoma margrebowiei TaxID=48269 RepID=A0AA85AIR5_9TREM|nr:unnamed protein product [Schistosoma margrebowiei]
MFWRILISIWFMISLFITNGRIEITAEQLINAHDLFDNISKTYQQMKEELDNLTQEVKVTDITGSGKKSISNGLLTGTSIALFTIITLR